MIDRCLLQRGELEFQFSKQTQQNQNKKIHILPSTLLFNTSSQPPASVVFVTTTPNVNNEIIAYLPKHQKSKPCVFAFTGVMEYFHCLKTLSQGRRCVYPNQRRTYIDRAYDRGTDYDYDSGYDYDRRRGYNYDRRRGFDIVSIADAARNQNTTRWRMQTTT